MNGTSAVKFNIRDEMRLIPKAMYGLAALLVVTIEALFLALFRHDRAAPPLALQIPVGILAGSILAFFILLVGYVNRDAKRRGMNYVLWTILVLFIPNAIGYIIYFVVRQPVMVPCPQCGTIVKAAFNFCPKCKFSLHPVCPQCHRPIEGGAAFCPYCAAELKVQA